MLAVGIVAASVALVAIAVPLYTVLAERSRVAGAADAAALAAADAASGAIGGSPCEQAERVASANGARVDGCTLDGLVATVRVAASVGGFEVTGIATAGPPGSR